MGRPAPRNRRVIFVITTSKITILGLLIWIICASFYSYELLLRTILGTFEHPISYDLNIDVVKFAFLSSTAYQFIYGAMQIPVGVIAARFGLKKTLLFAITVCVTSVVGFGVAQNYSLAIIFRVMMGFGSAFGFICILIAVYEWLPKKHIGLFIGLSGFIGTVGPIVAAGPLNDLAMNTGINWRYVFFSLAGIGLVIALLVLLLVRNNKSFISSFTIVYPQKPILSVMKQLFVKPQVFFIGFYSAFVYFAIEYLSENSGKLYVKLMGFSHNQSSYMITVAWIGFAIGCPLVGFLSDRMARRKPMMIFSATCCVCGSILLIFFPFTITLLTAAFFLIGFGASGQTIGFAIIAENCRKEVISIGLAVNNAILMLVAAVNAPLIGWILNLISSSEQFTAKDYQQAFLLILAFNAIAVLISIFYIKETYCKSVVDLNVVNQ